ncbi:MAG: hypothetical protein WC593_15090 [Methanoregula sp.]
MDNREILRFLEIIRQKAPEMYRGMAGWIKSVAMFLGAQEMK